VNNVSTVGDKKVGNHGDKSRRPQPGSWVLLNRWVWASLSVNSSVAAAQWFNEVNLHHSTTWVYACKRLYTSAAVMYSLTVTEIISRTEIEV